MIVSRSRFVKILSKVLISFSFAVSNRSRSVKNSGRVLDRVDAMFAVFDRDSWRRSNESLSAELVVAIWSPQRRTRNKKQSMTPIPDFASEKSQRRISDMKNRVGELRSEIKAATANEAKQIKESMMRKRFRGTVTEIDPPPPPSNFVVKKCLRSKLSRKIRTHFSLILCLVFIERFDLVTSEASSAHVKNKQRSVIEKKDVQMEMFECSCVESSSGAFEGDIKLKLKFKLKSSEGVDDNAQVISCLTPKQEHLLIENVPDPLAGKQTWPTEEEIVEAERNHKEKELKNKMLLRGTSDYQAAWIVNNSDVDNSKSKENDDGDSPSTVTGSLANEVIELTEVEVEFFNALKSSKLSSFSLLLPLSAQYLKEKCLSFELAMSMLEHSDEIDSSAESVTTSTCIGQQIVTKRLGKCLLELSGNNVIFIMDDAEIELVVRSVLFVAVGIDGQHCTTSRRRLLDDETVYQKVLERLLEIYKQIKWGSLGEGYLTWTTAYMCFKGEF